MVDTRVALLLRESNELWEAEEAAHIKRGENGEKQLFSAVQLLKQAEAGGFARPEALAPENHLLCAEAALKQKSIELARRCVEHFLDTRPPSNQFLVRAYYAIGLVEAAECSAAKGEELVSGTLTAL